MDRWRNRGPRFNSGIVLQGSAARWIKPSGGNCAIQLQPTTMETLQFSPPGGANVVFCGTPRPAFLNADLRRPEPLAALITRAGGE